ncbi:hypothetical protein FALBO_5043 [Fusarium albosuccineum]|uniref:Uncharacterized protein n=1 Tax=Fusarium albosuccineum TaxID=1237068 RepID=A0A8H4LH75_9HYPO|nr:hypothetical protein FALBO_5043 [Fusarium albosuccineum]
MELSSMDGTYRPLPTNASAQDASPAWQENCQTAGQSPERTEKASPGYTSRFRGLPARRRSRPKLWLRVIAKWLGTTVILIIIYVILLSYSAYDVLILAFKSSRLSIHLSVLVWILLFLGSQIGYASVRLCYSVDKTEDVALLVPGNFSIANLATIETQRVIKSSDSARAQQYVANSYGTVSLALNQGDADKLPKPGTLFFNDDDHFFCGDNYCTYVFHEANTKTVNDPDAIPVIATTNRSVNATAQCSAHRVTQGGNGTAATIKVRVDSKDVEVPIPIQGGPDQSTYMTTMTKYCGDDCSMISVFEASSTEPWFHNCTSKLGQVLNAARPEHQLGQNLTRLATSAIALQGYATNGDVQSSSYPAASIFGAPVNGSSEDTQFVISRFTVGVLSTTIDSNTDVTLNGKTPTIGQKLNVSHWNVIHCMFWITASLQLLLAVVVTLVAEKVIVPDRDPLEEVQILRSMVTDEDPPRLGSEMTGSTMTIGGTRSLWIFRDKYVGDGLYDLYMERVSGPT